MNLSKRTTLSSSNEPSLDTMQAQLNALMTEYMFVDPPCQCITIAIRDLLNRICHHPEMDFFPEQRMVQIKMLNLWRTKAHTEQHRNNEQAQQAHHHH
ncbi:MAG: hypothetical protein ACRBHB_18945 [Arenicella sp.]